MFVLCCSLFVFIQAFLSMLCLLKIRSSVVFCCSLVVSSELACFLFKRLLCFIVYNFAESVVLLAKNAVFFLRGWFLFYWFAPCSRLTLGCAAACFLCFEFVCFCFDNFVLVFCSFGLVSMFSLLVFCCSSYVSGFSLFV